VNTKHLAEDPMEANFSLPSRPARSAVSGRSILVLVAATLLVPLAAHLSPSEHLAGPSTRNVAYAYGEVTNAARVPALYRRFEREALELCGEAGLLDGVGSRSQLDCAERVVDRAVREVDAPALSAYHQSREDSTQATRVASAR
jgi:UrcA family protein